MSHPDEGLESLDGWKLQVAIPYNHHKAYLLTAENSVVVDANIEGVEGGFAFVANPDENPFPMTGMGFTGALVPGFDYRLYDDTGGRVDFGIACYKRGDIFHVLKNMEDPSVSERSTLRHSTGMPTTLEVNGRFQFGECTGSPSLQGINLVGRWADLKKQ